MANRSGKGWKQTPERVERIMEALAAGSTRKAASEYAGIDQDTMIRWMHRDSEFADSVTRAEAQVEVRAGLTIKRAFDDGDWRAAAFWLERRRNGEWGQQARVEIINSVREMARAAGKDVEAAVAEAEAFLREIRANARRGG